MANIKKMLANRDPELPIISDITQAEQDWEQTGAYAEEVMGMDFDGDALPAKSFKASGRHCPKCSDRMRVKEVTDNGTIIVMCFNCHSTYHHDDLNAWETDENEKRIIDATTENLYRSIPQEAINHWMTFFQKTKGKS